MDEVQIGLIIKWWREDFQLSQGELVKRIAVRDLGGRWSRQKLSNLEAGRQRLLFSEAVLFASIFKTTLDKFVDEGMKHAQRTADVELDVRYLERGRSRVLQ